MPPPGRERSDPGPGPATDGVARRSVVPPAAGRSLWLAAAWTGAGTALLAMIVSIAVVAVAWLPASAGAGSAGKAIRAGVLTFLAALHAGITVGGIPTAFVPLGLTVLVGAVAWRAGCGLADAADSLDEGRTRPLMMAGVVQAFAFAVVCGVAAVPATLGSSSVSVVGVVVAGFVLFAVSGGVAFVRWSALGERLGAVTPSWVARVARAAAAGVIAYLGAGALLVAAALVVHHDRVEALSAQVGGGWSGVPILALGVLAAPNAVVAATAYLSGPGFALGTGDHVSLLTTAHGTLPAFPLLGAVPSGPGATWPVWTLAAIAPLAAGAAVATVLRRAPGRLDRLRETALAALVAAGAGLVLAWQAGGAVGSGRLNAVGASPWQAALALGVTLAVGSGLALAGAALVSQVRRRRRPAATAGVLRSTLAGVVAEGVAAYRSTRDAGAADPAPAATTSADGTTGSDKLAG